MRTNIGELVVAVLLLLSTSVSVAADQGVSDEVNLLTVPFISQPATIDGSLSESVWQSAARIAGFVHYEALTLAKNKTTVLMYYDAERLYFGVTCMGDDTSKLTQGSPGGERDTIGLCLDLDNDGESFFLIIVNSLGVTAEGRCPSAVRATWLPWDPKLSSAATVDSENWTVELSIPFAELGVGQPELGDVWGANAYRRSYTALPDAYELSAWTRLKGSFFQPEHFGLVRFGGSESLVARLISLGPDSIGKDAVKLEILNPGPEEREVLGRLRFDPLGSDKPARERRVSVPAGGRIEMTWPVEIADPNKYGLDLCISESTGTGAILRTKLDLAYFPEFGAEDNPLVIKLDGLYKDVGQEKSALSIGFHHPKQEPFVDTELVVRLVGPNGDEVASRKVRPVADKDLSFEFPLTGLQPGRYEYRVVATAATDGRTVAEARKSFCLMPIGEPGEVGEGKLPGFFVSFWGRTSPNLEEHGIRGSGFNTIFCWPDCVSDERDLRTFQGLATGPDHAARVVEAVRSDPRLGAWLLRYEADERGVHPDELEPCTTQVRSLDVEHPVAIHLSNTGSLTKFLPVADLFLVNSMWAGTSLDVVLEIIDKAHKTVTKAGKSAGYMFYMWGKRSPGEFRVAPYYALLKGDKGVVFHMGDASSAYDPELWSIIRGVEWETHILSAILAQSSPAELVEVIEPSLALATKSANLGTADVVPVGPLFMRSVRTEAQDYLILLNPHPLAVKFRARMKEKYQSAHVLFDESNVAINDGILDESIPAYGAKTYCLNPAAGR